MIRLGSPVGLLPGPWLAPWFDSGCLGSTSGCMGSTMTLGMRQLLGPTVGLVNGGTHIFLGFFFASFLRICFTVRGLIAFSLLLAFGGFWLLVAFGFRRLLAFAGVLAFGGFWLLVAFGFWWLLAFGGFWLLPGVGFWWLLAFGGFCSEGCFHIDH